MSDPRLPAQTLLLVGNPNAGKTSLFNALTGEHRHVGNWPGVTVERLEGSRSHGGIFFRVLDLPGTYSLHPFTPEERIAIDALQEHKDALLLNVVDGTNLERNLVLTMQLVEQGFRPLLVINFADELARRGGKIDVERFSAMLGLRAVLTNARHADGIKDLLDALPAASRDSSEVAQSAKNVEGLLGEDCPSHELCQAAVERFDRIAQILKYVFIAPPAAPSPWQQRFDDLVTHRWLGIPLFLSVMAFVFWSTFTLSTPISHLLEHVISGSSAFLRAVLPARLLTDLLIDGILTGVGGVLVFLPCIAVLFFWIALLEDSGYMSRAAFLVDRLMQGLGLHGRAFLPLIMGFGCNVPAVMATRILDNPLQRRKTMLLIPMMGCSARMPVLVLLSGTFFPKTPGLHLFAVYLINFLLMLLIARALKHFFQQDSAAPFLLEMPPFRLPAPRAVLLTLHEKLGHFLEKAATVILAGAIIVWALNTFPREVPLSRPYEDFIATLQPRAQAGDRLAMETIAALSEDRDRETFAGRYIAKLGCLLEPAVRPFGCGWREGVALIPGFLAKETIISTLSVLYRPLSPDLGQGMRNAGLTPLAGLAYMLFTLLYVPCLPTVGVVYRESGSLPFTIVAALLPGVLAWTIAVVLFQFGMLFL
ncbi:MAG: ferrous iron transport protein B [Candidatus Ozemobacteraceae bacterium]